MNKLRLYIFSALLIIFMVGGYAAYILETGNFHTITPGEAYRTAQLSGSKLSQYIEAYHIKSVMNLRGQNPEKEWYENEIRTCKKYGIEHYDLALSSTHEPNIKAIKKMLEIFTSAPRPILIHCQYGADRSGLVAAMWKVIVDKEPKSEAKKQLSVWYGHVPFKGRDAMDRFFEEWNPEDRYSY
jgi:protein tyrosine/serine phosphatase